MDPSLFEEVNFLERFAAIEELEAFLETRIFGATADRTSGRATGDGRVSGGPADDGRFPGETADDGRFPGETTDDGLFPGETTDDGLFPGETADDDRRRRLIAALEAVDQQLFARLRAEIGAGGHRGDALRKLLMSYCARSVGDGAAYDELDVFVNRLFSYLPMPTPVLLLEPGMVDFHKTPARVVLELARWVGPGDVFVDLGAGLGQVVLLVHLLTGAVACGLEIKPAFCRYARDCAKGLGLTRVSFIEGDARFADDEDFAGAGTFTGDGTFTGYREGTVFFMYTPFTGEILATVFELLRRQSLVRTFTVITFGPCTVAANGLHWLQAAAPLPDPGDGLGIFSAVCR